MEMRTGNRERGLTLVELLVAVAIGLVISSAVLGVYVNAVRSLADDERYARMQENGRFALQLVADDLMMADFWGQTTGTDAISTGLVVPVGNCAVDIDLFDADTAVLFNNYHAGATHFTPCVQVTGNRQAGTDVVAIKRTEGLPVAETFVDVNDVDGDGDTLETLTTGAGNLENGRVYLRTNGTSAQFIDNAASWNPPDVEESDWVYAARLYYVRDYFDSPGDGVPALCRLVMDDDDPRFDWTPQCLAEGIEDLHLQFGIDTDSDGVANVYTTTPTLSQMENVATVRIYVLARSTDPTPGYQDSKSYVLGDVVVAPPNDGYYRTVFNTTVSMRNTVNRSLMQ